MSAVADWLVASDRVSRLVLPAAYRAGSHISRGAQRVPEKWGHAVESGTDRTLCGKPVRGLFRFDAMLFEHLGHHLRCRACDEAAGYPHATPVSGIRRQAASGRTDALVGGGEGDPDVPDTGDAVELARSDQDAELGEPGDGLPAALVARRPEIERGLGVIDPEA